MALGPFFSPDDAAPLGEPVLALSDGFLVDCRQLQGAL
jgi:hypothetical protein